MSAVQLEHASATHNMERRVVWHLISSVDEYSWSPHQQSWMISHEEWTDKLLTAVITFLMSRDRWHCIKCDHITSLGWCRRSIVLVKRSLVMKIKQVETFPDQRFDHWAVCASKICRLRAHTAATRIFVGVGTPRTRWHMLYMCIRLKMLCKLTYCDTRLSCYDLILVRIDVPSFLTLSNFQEVSHKRFVRT